MAERAAGTVVVFPLAGFRLSVESAYQEFVTISVMLLVETGCTVVGAEP